MKSSINEPNIPIKKTSITLITTSAFAFCAAVLLASNGIASEKDTLNAADVKFIKQEAAAGMAVVKTAGLGSQKTSREDIKAFAQMLVTDHTAANEQLAKLATSKGVETSTVINPKDAEHYQTLEKSSGTEFDKEFLAEIIRGHKKCVSNFEEASNDAKDSELKAWATATLPTLKTHLGKAMELSAK
jgi:putative membrane protein